MHWDINDLKDKLSQINERIKYENDEKTLLTLRVDAETINEMINYISNPDVIKSDYEYTSNLIFRSNINQTGEFLINNHNGVIDLSRDLSLISKLPSRILFGKRISDGEYYDLVDKFFKSFDTEQSKLYREIVDTKRAELNPKKYSFGGIGVAHHLNTFQSTYVASRHNGTLEMLPTLPHEVGHAYQLLGVSDIDIDINYTYSLFRESYAEFIGYAFNDFLKETKYNKYAFNSEWGMLDKFIMLIESEYTNYANLANSEFYEHSFHFNDGCECTIDTYRSFYSTIYALHFINMYRQDKLKCMKELNKFNDLVGRVSDEEIISLYSNESLINSIKNVGNNYLRTYRRR